MRFFAFLVGFFFSCFVFADEMELIFYRAPQALDWSTPGRLVRSTFRNQFIRLHGKVYPHSISHVNVRLQCGTEDSVYVGMTSEKSSGAYLSDFLFRGISLDTFLINVKGRFVRTSDVLDWLPVLKSEGYVRSLKVLLNSDQCARAKRYLRLYRELGIQEIYGGLRSLPLRGEGAGCSAFGVSFLQVLGLFPAEIDKAWSRSLNVPIELLSSRSRRARIGFFGFLRGRDRSWALPHEDHIRMRFWDPELMYSWVGAMAQKPSLPAYLSIYKESHSPFMSVLWDARNYPLKSESIFSYSVGTMKKTVRYHLENRGRRLSEEEILNISSRPCRLFRACPLAEH